MSFVNSQSKQAFGSRFVNFKKVFVGNQRSNKATV